jgi:hypothetical protein
LFSSEPIRLIFDRLAENALFLNFIEVIFINGRKNIQLNLGNFVSVSASDDLVIY